MRKMIDDKHQLKLDSLYNIDDETVSYHARPEEVVIIQHNDPKQFEVYINKLPANSYNFREIALKCLEINPNLLRIALHVPWREIIRLKKTNFSFNTQDENGDVLADYYDFTAEVQFIDDTGYYQNPWNFTEDGFFTQNYYVGGSFTEVYFHLWNGIVVAG